LVKEEKSIPFIKEVRYSTKMKIRIIKKSSRPPLPKEEKSFPLRGIYQYLDKY
jgi:hypothetical protein